MIQIAFIILVALFKGLQHLATNEGSKENLGNSIIL